MMVAQITCYAFEIAKEIDKKNMHKVSFKDKKILYKFPIEELKHMDWMFSS